MPISKKAEGRIALKGTKGKLSAKFGKNKDDSWWLGVENKNGKNLRYVSKKLPIEQLTASLAVLLVFSEARGYLRKHPHATRMDIIRHLKCKLNL